MIKVIRYKEIKVLIFLLILYSVIVYYRIGSKDIPVTYWRPIDRDSIVEIKFEKPFFVKNLIIYFGYGSGKLQVGIESSDKNLNIIDIDSKNFHYTSIAKVHSYVKRIVIFVKEPGVNINEIALIDRNNKIISNKNFTYKYIRMGRANGELKNLFDEQLKVRISQSYVYNSYYDFDEIYHARTAYEFAYGLPPYDLVHPPLGKYIIMLGIKLWGPTPFGWRFFNALFGIMNLLLIYILLFNLFKKHSVALLGAGLFSVDFMNFTMSRWANLDTFTVFFVLLTYILALKAFEEIEKNEKNAKRKFYMYSLMTGICTGLAFSCKWNTLYSISPLLFILIFKLLSPKKYFKNKADNTIKERFEMLIKSLLTAITSASIIYFIVYLPVTIKSGNLMTDFIMLQKHILKYHSGLQATHPFSSKWYEWLILKKPVWIFFDSSLPPYLKSVVVIMGNPAICYVGLIMVIVGLFESIYNKEKREKLMIPFLGYTFSILPWIFVSRITFLYHYYLAIPFLIMNIVVVYENTKLAYKKQLAIILFIISALFFVLFYPVISGMPVQNGYIEKIKIFKSWVF